MTLKILGISGSLREKSVNTRALRAAGAVMPAGMQLEIADYGDVPLYNQDLQDRGIPPAVERLRAAIESADGVLFASPEYNFSISGVLKNAIDWVSRTSPQPFKGKPVAIMSATSGLWGGARHQYELRKILGSMDALALVKPEVLINLALTKFDADGQLTDANTLKTITDQMAAFRDWIVRLQPRD
ncbi:NAD(P)H-dependent oxidoreductase [Ramlibacter sp. AW1]|uniref:NAD(P)H-dependent oxidoreductase n=1 Tax=Ramlibacter aurantiacus TaxID=2801330 RepID=A0A936ZHQ9_9BURK|nr:NADPH-dependent FMN reductase [Ramlibacter aurantiacus]MBL0420077.1 NAD(P)H-dependent oxidoreductase [Ramlibacter aurantiacus]